MLTTLFLILTSGFAKDPELPDFAHELNAEERDFISIASRYCTSQAVESKTVGAETFTPTCVIRISEKGEATLNFNVLTTCGEGKKRCMTSMEATIPLPPGSPFVVVANRFTCGSEDIICTLRTDVPTEPHSANRTITLESFQKGSSAVLMNAVWRQRTEENLLIARDLP